MKKEKRADFIEEVHERSEHNLNPYYWFNRVNSFSLAELRASLAVSVIEFIVFSLSLLFVVVVMITERSFFRYAIPFGFLFIFWLLTTARAIKWFVVRRQTSDTVEFKSKERKKKTPKHRKDYGRD
jgi:hypothetical protein